MQFLLIVVISLVVLGAIAALSSIGSTDEPIVQKEGDCASCTSKTDCKLAELKEDIRRKKEEKCHHHDLTSVILLLTSSILYEEQYGKEPLLAVVHRPLQHVL